MGKGREGEGSLLRGPGHAEVGSGGWKTVAARQRSWRVWGDVGWLQTAVYEDEVENGSGGR